MPNFAKIRAGFNPTGASYADYTTDEHHVIELKAEFVREKVARGSYASDSEVLRDAVRALRERDRAIEAWLLDRVVSAAKTLWADPNRALSEDDVRAQLAKAPSPR